MKINYWIIHEMTYLCPVYKNVTLRKNTPQWNKKLFLLWENGKMPLPLLALKWVLCLHEGIQLIQVLKNMRNTWKLYWFHLYGRIFTRQWCLKKSPAPGAFILFKQRIINLWGNERKKDSQARELIFRNAAERSMQGSRR